MFRVTAIVPRGEGTGFSLAGVRVLEISHTADVSETLETEMSDDRNGVILIDETFLEALPSRIRRKADESTVPLVVGFPIIKKWEYVHDRREVIENIIRRSVGYRIKIETG